MAHGVQYCNNIDCYAVRDRQTDRRTGRATSLCPMFVGFNAR